MKYTDQNSHTIIIRKKPFDTKKKKKKRTSYEFTYLKKVFIMAVDLCGADDHSPDKLPHTQTETNYG